MADNDERWIPEVKGEDPQTLLTSINDTIRLIFQALHILEGRVGEIPLRDSLRSPGDVTAENRLQLLGLEAEPDVSADGELALYYDTDGGEVMVSVDEGAWTPLVPPVEEVAPIVVSLEDGVAKQLFSIALPSPSGCGGTFRYQTMVRSTTDEMQVETGTVSFAAIQDSGGYITDIDKSTTSFALNGLSSGSPSFAIVTGVDSISFQVTLNSSLVVAEMDIRYYLDEYGPGEIVFLA